MFADAQTTLNILVTLEDAFIAAYLVGVRNFSTRNLRVTAARIMGIESDHRTLARVIGPDVTKKFGGPIETITGISGVAESVDPPNNNGYERTLCWTSIDQAVNALLPFVDFNAANDRRLRHLKILPIRTLHPDPAVTTRSIRLLHRLLTATSSNASSQQGHPGDFIFATVSSRRWSSQPESASYAPKYCTCT